MTWEIAIGNKDNDLEAIPSKFFHVGLYTGEVTKVISNTVLGNRLRQAMNINLFDDSQKE